MKLSRKRRAAGVDFADKPAMKSARDQPRRRPGQRAPVIRRSRSGLAPPHWPKALLPDRHHAASGAWFDSGSRGISQRYPKLVARLSAQGRCEAEYPM